MIAGPSFLHEVIGHFYERQPPPADGDGRVDDGGGGGDAAKARWTLKPKMAFLQTPQDL